VVPALENILTTEEVVNKNMQSKILELKNKIDNIRSNTNASITTKELQTRSIQHQ
jgi:hypothetical protein